MDGFKEQILKFENHLELLAKNFLPTSSSLQVISDSIKYSLFSGGKRFRPLLCFATAELFELDPEKTIPLATAIEFIHTYSLIHDDLPCMDDDDLRRGKPSNHKKFGEDIALLAGDALISEAQKILVQAYSGEQNFKDLFVEFSDSIGVQGMIAGQVLDLRLTDTNFDEMKEIHFLKTGQLIKLAIKGVGYLVGIDSEKLNSLNDLSLNLGFAFQIKDDLQDFMAGDESDSEANMVNVIGLEKTQHLIQSLSKDIKTTLQTFSGDPSSLQALIDYNLNREN